MPISDSELDAILGEKAEPLTARANGFDGSGYWLGGRELHAFSPSRYRAADAMGWRFQRLDADQQTELARTSGYPGMAQDVGIVLWLMNVGPSQVERAIRNPEWALSQMAVWYDDAEMGWSGRNFGEALRIYSSVIADKIGAMEAFNAAAKTEDETEGPEDRAEDVGKPSTGQDSWDSSPESRVTVSVS
ncbi:MAG TPA: hypothetical protein VFI76_01925 [Terrimicrobiaceae bacterium]|nr:hypothetical protein [Terrimicrobiaceae bacterium]